MHGRSDHVGTPPLFVIKPISFQARGWNVRVLTANDARTHPHYSALVPAFAAYPSVRNHAIFFSFTEMCVKM